MRLPSFAAAGKNCLPQFNARQIGQLFPGLDYCSNYYTL
jgi:hypothetical protein